MGTPGEILIRSYMLMQGYYRKPEETAKAIDADGWMHSGDMGVFREDGQPVSIGFALLRDFVVRFLLFGFIGIFLIGLPGLVDLLWPLWDERNQTLHDKIVSSYVIKADTPPMAAPA